MAEKKTARYTETDIPIEGDVFTLRTFGLAQLKALRKMEDNDEAGMFTYKNSIVAWTLKNEETGEIEPIDEETIGSIQSATLLSLSEEINKLNKWDKVGKPPKQIFEGSYKAESIKDIQTKLEEYLGTDIEINVKSETNSANFN